MREWRFSVLHTADLEQFRAAAARYLTPHPLSPAGPDDGLQTDVAMVELGPVTLVCCRDTGCRSSARRSTRTCNCRQQSRTPKPTRSRSRTSPPSPCPPPAALTELAANTGAATNLASGVRETELAAVVDEVLANPRPVHRLDLEALPHQAFRPA
ncbi:hypothetical protein [Amycolatopsis rubida]|uniref:Uncharacterized protein n=1 Tax=Amycolatopsis rubida TaxID=112413 RepID=A0A1I5YWQ3_9PSEU|nr:hypothetical protein [Amycolatopsis rubida]SFQ48666.1 hypothetical protein SAMN05421854_11387 [Amycolatopsis rubida]